MLNVFLNRRLTRRKMRELMRRAQNCTCCLLRIGGVDVLLRGSRARVFDRSSALVGLVDGLLLRKNDDGIRERFLEFNGRKEGYTWACWSECGNGFNLYFF